jgi:hypothetical protein
MLVDATAAYGDRLKEHQEVLGHAADVIIEIYAVESGLARTEKLVRARGRDGSAAAVAMAQVHASDAADRIAHSASQVGRALAAQGKSTALLDAVARLAQHPGVDSIGARQRIAEAVIEAGRHPY